MGGSLLSEPASRLQATSHLFYDLATGFLLEIDQILSQLSNDANFESHGTYSAVLAGDSHVSQQLRTYPCKMGHTCRTCPRGDPRDTLMLFFRDSCVRLTPAPWPEERDGDQKALSLTFRIGYAMSLVERSFFAASDGYFGVGPEF
jgi:hypothetical protein